MRRTALLLGIALALSPARGDLLSCSDGSTPEPTTTAPTPTPTTPSPTTPEPATPDPDTPEAETSEPATPEPLTGKVLTIKDTATDKIIAFEVKVNACCNVKPCLWFPPGETRKGSIKYSAFDVWDQIYLFTGENCDQAGCVTRHWVRSSYGQLEIDDGVITPFLSYAYVPGAVVPEKLDATVDGCPAPARALRALESTTTSTSSSSTPKKFRYEEDRGQRVVEFELAPSVCYNMNRCTWGGQVTGSFTATGFHPYDQIVMYGSQDCNGRGYYQRTDALEVATLYGPGIFTLPAYAYIPAVLLPDKYDTTRNVCTSPV